MRVLPDDTIIREELQPAFQRRFALFQSGPPQEHALGQGFGGEVNGYNRQFLSLLRRLACRKQKKREPKGMPRCGIPRRFGSYIAASGPFLRKAEGVRPVWA